MSLSVCVQCHVSAGEHSLVVVERITQWECATEWHRKRILHVLVCVQRGGGIKGLALIQIKCHSIFYGMQKPYG